MSVQGSQSHEPRVLWQLRTPLVKKGETSTQSRSCQASQLRKWLAILAIATWTAVATIMAVQELSANAVRFSGSCTAGSTIPCASAVSDRTCTYAISQRRRYEPECTAAHASLNAGRLESAAILPNACFAIRFRNLFAGVPLFADSKPAQSRAEALRANVPSFRCSHHRGWSHEAASRSLCTESLCHACRHRTSTQGAARLQEYAIPASLRSQSFGQSGKTNCRFAENDPTEFGRLAELCHTSATTDPKRSPGLCSSDSKCREGLESGSSGLAASAAVGFSNSPANVFDSHCSGSFCRSRNEYGSRWPASATTLDCTNSTEFCSFTAAICTIPWILPSAQHSHDTSCFPIPAASGSSGLCRPISRKWIFVKWPQWNFWPISCSNHAILPRCTFATGFQPDWFLVRVCNDCSYALASQLLPRWKANSSRTYPCRIPTSDGRTSRKLGNARASSQSGTDVLYGYTSAQNSCANHGRAIQSNDVESAHGSRGSDCVARDFTNDVPSQIIVWHCYFRAGTATCTSPLRACQLDAYSSCTKARARTACGSQCHYRKPRTCSDHGSHSSCPGDPSRVQILLHSMARSASATSSTTSNTSCCPDRTSIDSELRASTCASHACPTWSWRVSGGALIPRVAGTCGSREASQTERRKCERSKAQISGSSGDRIAAPSEWTFFNGIDGLRPSMAMRERAEDTQHGLAASFHAPKVLDFSDGFRALNLFAPVKLQLSSLLQPSSVLEKQFWTLREAVQSLRDPWPVDFLSWDLFAAISFLPDLSPELRCIFADCHHWNGETVEQIHLFTDGSASEANPSAWALVVIYECWSPESQQMRFLFRGFAGAILTDFSSWISHGPNVGEFQSDALSAELVGIIWALGWALQDSTCSVVHFHYDNLAAGQGVFGLWNPPKGEPYARLVKSATCLRQVLACQVECHGHHIKAHSGAPWNELADAIAKAVSKGVILSVDLPRCLPRFLHHAMIEHAWTEAAPTEPNDIRSCVEWPSVFRREGPPNPLLVDTFWNQTVHDSQATGQAKDLTVNLRIATANVLTLDVGPQSQQRSGKLALGRIGFLKTQLQPLQLHFVGLQEARSAGQVTRHSKDWWIFQSGCTDQGTHGVEIWASRTTPYGMDGNKPLFFHSPHFTVLAFHVRYLLIELCAPALQAHLLCLHSPFAKSSSMSPQQFWTCLDSTLSRRRNQHWPLIVMGDFNARIGSIQTSAVSNFQASIHARTSVACAFHVFSLPYHRGSNLECWLQCRFPDRFCFDSCFLVALRHCVSCTPWSRPLDRAWSPARFALSPTEAQRLLATTSQASQTLPQGLVWSINSQGVPARSSWLRSGTLDFWCRCALWVVDFQAPGSLPKILSLFILSATSETPQWHYVESSHN